MNKLILAAVFTAAAVTAMGFESLDRVTLNSDLTATPHGPVVAIVEDASDLKSHEENESADLVPQRVNLAKGIADFEGPSTYELRDGEIVENKVPGFITGVKGKNLAFDRTALGLNFVMFGVTKPGDYALSVYERYTMKTAKSGFVESNCYFDRVPVYRLKKGVINLIPKEIQAPLLPDPVSLPTPASDLPEGVKRILAPYPVSKMPLETAQLVAVVSFSPTGAQKRNWAPQCSSRREFKVLQAFGAPAN